jgi:hypothetical protein
MSSSPWERLWTGDEDVATPFPVVASIKVRPPQDGNATSTPDEVPKRPNRQKSTNK